MTKLPDLRTKILKGYLLILSIFGVAGTVLVVAAVFTATGLTPKAIHHNYDSIEATRKMQQAWTALNFPSSYDGRSNLDWVGQFDHAVEFSMGNITESGEAELLKEIQDIWKNWKASGGTAEITQKMNSGLERLTQLNESGMFGFVQRASEVRRQVIIGVIVFFLISLITTLVLANSVATRIAHPLKIVAGVLHAHPKPGENLELPNPTSVELEILFEELQGLWERISRLDKLNLEKIVQQSNHLQTLLSSVEDAIMVFDSAGKVTYANNRMSELLRLRMNEVIDSIWDSLQINSDNYIKLKEAIKNRVSNDSPTVELDVAQGKARSFAGRFRDVIADDGKLVSTIILLRDVTEIRQQDRLKAEFIGVLSHELKTPIQSLGTATEILAEKKLALDATTQLLVDTIFEDVARIRTIANHFMQAGHLSLGTIRINTGLEDLSLLVPDWIKPFHILASDKGIKLEYIKEGSEKIYCEIDKLRFPWVISNLLSNAIRLSPQNSVVTILLTDRNQFVEIKISDQGPGISEDIQKRMFEPFFMGSSQNSSNASGTLGFLGLGLTIAKEVTEGHRGQIEYHKVRPSGACFRVLLPFPTVGVINENSSH